MKRLFTPSREGLRAERVLRKAVARMVEESRRLGIPVAVMRNGKAVSVSADEAIRIARKERKNYRPKRRSISRRRDG